MSDQPTACCDMMALQLGWRCDAHSVPFDCPDALVLKGSNFYGLIVHDGGRSVIPIAFCPWCARPL